MALSARYLFRHPIRYYRRRKLIYRLAQICDSLEDMDRILVDIDDLTDRQIMLAILYETYGLRKNMADLSQAVADLQVAVQGVVDRVGPTVDDLKAQVAAGVAALEAFAAADSTEDAAYEQAIADLQAALQSQVDGAQAAADSIGASVAVLNEVAAVPAPDPEPPVE